MATFGLPSPSDLFPRRKLIPYAVLLLGGSAACWLVFKRYGSPRIGIDDANIFFSYAENLARGRGFAYGSNPEQVEGFTSLLWTLLTAGLFKAGLGERSVLGLTIVLLLGTQLLVLDLIRSCAEEEGKAPPRYQIAYLSLVLCSPAYVVWMTVTLMDTSLWGFFVAAMVREAVYPPAGSRRRLLGAAPFILAPLVRPEGFVVAPALLAFLWLRRRTADPGGSRTFCLTAGGGTIATALALTAFRVVHFGYPFPNTFYAKVAPTLELNLRTGRLYLEYYLASGAVVGIAALIALVVAAVWAGRLLDRALRSPAALSRISMTPLEALSASLLLLLLLPVPTGGDHFLMFRFYQPSYPVLCSTLTVFLMRGGAGRAVDGPRPARWGPFGTLALGAALAYWLFAHSSATCWRAFWQDLPMKHEFRIAEEGRETGRTLDRLFHDSPRLPSVAVIIAGGISRSYPGPLVDLMGLNDLRIAHSGGKRPGLKNHAAFARPLFYEREPDLLIASPPQPPATSSFESEVLDGLLEDPRFVTRWAFGVFEDPRAGLRTVELFARRDFLARMAGSPTLRFRETMRWSERWTR